MPMFLRFVLAFPLALGLSASQSHADGARISWETAVRLVKSGRVAGVHQADDLEVSLFLRSGATLKTTEPGADAILRVVQTSGWRTARMAVVSG